MSLRRMRRTAALACALALCAFRYWLERLCGPLTLERRAVWLQSAARGVLASLDVQFNVEGRPPTRGLLVSNHLSYLDILLYAAAEPCFFIAKSEVGKWPYFGWAASAGGTIFLERTSLAGARLAANQIAGRLALPIPVLLFPEGTSTDGNVVLPFRARLFQPAVEARAPVAAAAVRYIASGDEPERELCWFGDAPFLPHLWKLLGGAGFRAQIRYGQPQIYSDARIAACATRDVVVRMRAKPGRSMDAAFELSLAGLYRASLLER
jgi:1-acyl-sn-glycerol-3-phosphate acyltransferase